MEPQHTSVPFSATFANHSQQPSHQPSPNTTPDEVQYTYNEKDYYPQQQHQQRPRDERGSKTSSNGRGRDSVISHPFSPKQSYPPSPTSSISSVSGGRRHHSVPEIQSSAPVKDSQNITCPPQAHLDPEKHGYNSSQEPRSHRHSASARGASDAVYDQGEYHEKEPEEKAWQLLVRIQSLQMSLEPCLTCISFTSQGPALCFQSSSPSGPLLRFLFRSCWHRLRSAQHGHHSRHSSPRFSHPH